MQSSDDEQYGNSPVSVKNYRANVTTEVGDFVFSPLNSRATSQAESDDEYSNLLLSQRLDEISLDKPNLETKDRKDRISIDSTDSNKSDSSTDILLGATAHTEQKERLESINQSASSQVILNSESNDEITGRIIADMSRSNAGLGRKLDLRELRARRDALKIRLLEEQCRALMSQLRSFQQERDANAAEAERLSQEKITSEIKKNAVERELERVGY